MRSRRAALLALAALSVLAAHCPTRDDAAEATLSTATLAFEAWLGHEIDAAATLPDGQRQDRLAELQTANDAWNALVATFDAAVGEGRDAAYGKAMAFLQEHGVPLR